MELLFGIGALLLLAALAYGVHQSHRRREEKGVELPEEKVDRKGVI
ncbi:hypothetical protein NVS89_15370 [Ancylobacter sp. MQZ15Z-1]|uniref:Uncharacterized protein n=1 Tax=Ancylobacter mangrovi TaxID=2972472 RepID=A0A9X2PD37_9HYPH|nr:hypothetical protein [Ancylobacter mangrovi]MCS0496481.1 hypothetical protein [Ancylobacter mangrovi]